MVYPESTEITLSDGSKSVARRKSFYNENIVLKNYNVYITPFSGNLAVVKLSKELIVSYKDDIEVILLNKAKVQVTCKSAKIANMIVNVFHPSKLYNAYIPQQKVEVKGRIYMPKEISEQEAFEGMTVKNRVNTNAPLPSIVEVYRIPYFEKNSVSGEVVKTDSDYMLVSFCGSHIPTHVVFDQSLLIPVQAYFEPILQCKSCWFFGHSKRACRGKERCVKCGLTHTGDCIAPLFCVNCKGNHSSNDKRCLEFLKKKELSKAKALKTVSTGVEVALAPTPPSYNIFNKINFPALPERIIRAGNVPVVDKFIKKRRAEDNIVHVERIMVSQESILKDITEKIIKDISREKSFFTTIVEEVKSSSISADELQKQFSEKIKTLLKPLSGDPISIMDDSIAADGPFKHS